MSINIWILRRYWLLFHPRSVSNVVVVVGTVDSIENCISVVDKFILNEKCAIATNDLLDGNLSWIFTFLTIWFIRQWIFLCTCCVCFQQNRVKIAKKFLIYHTKEVGRRSQPNWFDATLDKSVHFVAANFTHKRTFCSFAYAINAEQTANKMKKKCFANAKMFILIEK